MQIQQHKKKYSHFVKCVRFFSDSSNFGVGLPIVSSILFGRFCRFVCFATFSGDVSLLRWLPRRRLFTIKIDTLFIIIVPRTLVDGTGVDELLFLAVLSIYFGMIQRAK